MTTMEVTIIQHKIFEVRGQKIMLDVDLAELYQIETRVLKQAVRRNIHRFPNDFMFELTKIEYEVLRSQIVILKNERGKHIKYMPFAFTEQGVAMLSSVLNSKKAIEINIAIMRTFVIIRKIAQNYSELSDKIKEIEGKFPEIYNVLNYLMKKEERKEIQESRIQIGYKK
ncbi:MAG: ORF6N domain-containing protein [Flavobacteriaceae bacterium]|nr:ORF6N domain-containing protein [Flavobacteriaceae bacterium]